MLIKIAERVKIDIKKHDIEFCKILINNTNVYNNNLSFALDELKQVYDYETIEDLKNALSRLVYCAVSYECIGYDRFTSSSLLKGASIDFKTERVYYAFSDLFLKLLGKPQVASIFNKTTPEQLELLTNHSNLMDLGEFPLKFTNL